METVYNHLFLGKVVRLDDKHFIDCTLDGCELIYSGGPVIFERTLLSRCRHTFGGPARATITYLQEVGLMNTAGAKWTDIPAALN